jgi:hypothetical protein
MGFEFSPTSVPNFGLREAKLHQDVFLLGLLYKFPFKIHFLKRVKNSNKATMFGESLPTMHQLCYSSPLFMT